MLLRLPANEIFVFGSNLAGRHGAGSAAHAVRYYGAQWGVGAGRTGRAYAIPTKNQLLNRLPLGIVAEHVQLFETYARQHPELSFKVVAIGCGLAGREPRQIAPFFTGCLELEHVQLPPEFTIILQQPRLV